MTGRLTPGNRSLPQLPYNGSIVHYGNEDVNDPWVRIEVKVQAPLITRDMLGAAIDQGWKSFVYGFLSRQEMSRHPLLAFIQRAKGNMSEHKRQALERYKRGEHLKSRRS